MSIGKSIGKISPERAAELLKALRIKNGTWKEPVSTGQALELGQQYIVPTKEAPAPSASSNSPAPISYSHPTDKYGNLITYNAKQKEFVTLAVSGASSILLGAAGTGKTTCMQGVVAGLLQSGRIPPLEAIGHKYLKSGTPGIVICSFTRRAVNNIRRNMSEEFKDNCITIHKLLEYEPVYYEILDPETQLFKNTMRFEPTRNSVVPLPASIKVLIIEESSMVSKEPLWLELVDALPHDVQFIFLGDIQQLPPVFGSAILGFKMLELPTIELTEVYRQALESPIIRLAHRILSGNPIPAAEYPDFHLAGQLTLHPWKKRIDSDAATATAALFLSRAIETGGYDTEKDAVLIPFNKAFGTIDLNKHIAQYLARKADKEVYEIIAGFNYHYLSVGDKVLVDKEDGIIEDITRNPKYFGKSPQASSTTLDYWGHNPKYAGAEVLTEEEQLEAMEAMLESAASGVEDKSNQASHSIAVRMLDTDREITLSSAAELNSLLLGYALTVHKSQGSEWRKVFLFLHQSHATMIQRELLYTAVTRAKEELYVICEPDSFTKGIVKQRIKGDTLAEKAEYFKGKLESELN